MEVKEIGCNEVYWYDPSQDKIQQWA